MTPDEALAELDTEGLADAGGMKPERIEAAVHGSEDVRRIAERVATEQSVEAASELLNWVKGYHMNESP